MKISEAAWKKYIKQLHGLDAKAADLMREWVGKHGLADRDALIRYAYAVSTKYGEASAALACQMYEDIAELSGKPIRDAEMADTASYAEVAKTVNGVLKHSQNIDNLANAVGCLVKKAGQDTTLKNAIRDKAEFAWIPSGDTCAFCMTLAANGWQPASKEALKGGHAEHIHANCDCAYMIRFNHDTEVAGYDPDKYLEMYENAEGKTSKEKINSMRRQMYQENKDEINAQKRTAYAERKEHEGQPDTTN